MSNFKILSGLALSSDAHPPETFCWKKAEENNNNIFTNRHIINFENNSHRIFIFYFNLRTRHEVHRAQAHTICTNRLIITDTERFVTALVVGLQDYRHLLANL